MKQFQVPQFLTVEDQVIGPFTIKQSLYLGGGIIVIVFFRIFFETYLFLILSSFIAAVALSLSYLKINNQPLPVTLKNAFLYSVRPRLYIWKREALKKEKRTQEAENKKRGLPVEQAPSKISNSKLSELAWSLDIKKEHNK